MKLQINWELLKQNAFVKKVFGNSNVDKSREFFVCTDSRLYKPNDIFITIKGENFDGFSYAEDVIKMGCEIMTFEDTPENVSLVMELVKKYPKISFLACSSSLEFYQELAREYGQIWKKNKKGRIVIGITGSNGKTTQKEMLFHYLNLLHPGKVYATEKNYNNHVGVPRTMLQLTEKIDYAIIEMGTNHIGEIKILCDIAMPDAGIITNIGEAHIGYFKSKENIFTEKGRLFHSVMENTNNNGFFILDFENSYLKKLPPHKNVIFFNSKNIPCVYENTQVTITYQKSTTVLHNDGLIGKHNFSNLVSTFLLSTSLFPGEENKQKLIEAAASFRPFKNRSSLIEDNGRTIFLDAYNASPTAMMASIEGFMAYCKKNKISNDNAFYILGDMNELGDFAEDLHEKTGKFLKDHGVTKVAFIGKYNQFYAQGYQQPAVRSATLEEFLSKHWKELKKEYIYFFIKGSRSLKLETILDATS